MTRVVAALAAGAISGLAITTTIAWIWLVYGADPNKDPLLSW